MVTINIVSGKNKLVVNNIKLLSSTYALKQTIKENIKNNKNIINNFRDINFLRDEYFLCFNGNKMNEKEPLINYGIKNNSNITIHKNINGGSKNPFEWIEIKILLIIGLFLAIILYIFLLVSGFLALISKLYGYSVTVLIKTVINFILKFFGIDGKTLKIDTIYSLISGIIKYLSIGLLLFTITYYLIYFYYFVFNIHSEKKKVSYSWTISRGVTIVYVIIYLLYRLPDIFSDFLLSITSEFEKPFSFINPAIIVTKKTYDEIKYGPLYPIFGFYFDFLEKLLNVYKTIRNSLTSDNGKYYDCGKDNDIQSLIDSVSNSQGKVILQISFNELLKVLKIDKNNSNDSFYFKMVNYFVCQILKLFNIFDNSLKKVGTLDDIWDMIYVSCIAGFFALISLLIAMIVYFFFY